MRVSMSNIDLASLSDEELLALNPEELEATEEPVEATEEHDGTEVPNDAEEAVEENTEQSEAQEEVQDETNTDSVGSDVSEPEENSEVDYEAFYAEMTKPFKANGREIQVDNPQDAIRLMQMGANYSKKMEAMKPKQALLKVLEDNKLDNAEQLGYLIDLANKKPEAIAKLVKESDINLYDFDIDQADGYSPNLEITQPSLFEEVLNDVLTENEDMVNVIGFMGQWDNESKDILYNEPNILRAIAEQKQNGLYDQIVGVIEQERLFGRLKDIPYLQAYSQVEKTILERQQQSKSFVAPRPKQSTTVR